MGNPRSAVTIIITFMLFLTSTGLSGEEENENLQRSKILVKMVSADNLEQYVNSTEIVLTVLIKKYSPGGEVKVIRGRKFPNASQRLHWWMQGLRAIKPHLTTDGARSINPENTSVYIAETGSYDVAKAKALEILKANNLNFKIRALPYLFVYHKGELVFSYTGYKCAGEKGEKLIKYVTDRLNNRIKVKPRIEIHSKPAEGSGIVWVMDNAAEDYRHPPFNDTLTALDEDGNKLTTIRGINISSTVGGAKPIAVSPDGKSVFTAENIADLLSRYNINGEKVWSLKEEVITVYYLDEKNLFALTSHGTIYGKSLLLVDPVTGKIKKKVELAGRDITVDKKNNALWLVGENIRKVRLETLETEFVIDKIGWCAISVDHFSDGAVVVSERNHSQVKGSKKRMLLVSPDGKIIREKTFKYDPGGVAVYRKKNVFWIAQGGRLCKFDREFKQTGSIRHSAGIIAANQEDGSIWAVCYYGELAHFSEDGNKLAAQKGFSRAQKWLAVSSPPLTEEVIAARKVKAEAEAAEELLRKRKVNLRALFDACKIYYFDNDTFPKDITNLYPDYVMETKTFALPGKEISVQTLKTACGYEINTKVTIDSPGSTILIQEKKGSGKDRYGITAEGKIITL